MITTLKRPKISPNKTYGLVIKETPALILIAEENDFVFDGFTIFKQSDIKTHAITDSGKYCAKIMKKEKNWQTPPKWVKNLDLSSWRTAIEGVRCDVVIIENEHIDGGFYIGPVLDLEERRVKIGWFDGVGKWGKPEYVNYNKITKVRFGDRYSTTHGKYLKWGDRQRGSLVRL